MSTAGQFSSKNPTIKRILKEASELANSPSPDYHAAPLETDLFEWHFTLRGPPKPSPFDGGLYHGRIVLPPAYPLKPPSFRFTTASGRFEVNREICLSISGHHEETWQPAWGVRTALVAIRSFMDTDAKGQLGGMDASDEVRRRFATQSASFRCAGCGKTNKEIIREQDEAVLAAGSENSKKEEVPEELQLAYREDLGAQNKVEEGSSAVKNEIVQSHDKSTNGTIKPRAPPQLPTTMTAPVLPQPPAPQLRQRRPPARQDQIVAPWIDKAIYGVTAALLVLIWVKYLA